MDNLHGYVRWRGDIAFDERPFNVVDNLVLSALAYVDLAGVVGPSDGRDAVTVAEAAERVRLARRDAPIRSGLDD